MSAQIKQRLASIEKKIPRDHTPEIWLTITYVITASEAEKEKLRCEAIKEYEGVEGRELNREKVNWTEVSIVETREQAERFGLVNKPNYPYPTVTRTFE